MSDKMPCKRCGRPTTADEWYQRGDQCVYIHFLCMVKEGQEIIESSKYNNALGRGAERAYDGRIAGIAHRHPRTRTFLRFNFPALQQKWRRKTTSNA
jgi:hypothetical protein